MWDSLPDDLLAHIFSYLPPDSLARAKTICRNWRSTAVSTAPYRHPPWFLSLPTRGRTISCYVHNPNGDNWHALPLDHITKPIRSISTIGPGLVLLRLTTTTSLQLAICNPFTKQFKTLPMLNVTRTNPAVGVIEHNTNTNSSQGFGYKIYVAGGMSEASSGGGAVYQPTVEMYDSSLDRWRIVGPTPVEFAVRLTVWTPNESVYSKGVLYWMTSARAYSVMGFELGTNRWTELSVPNADRLEFAALVPRHGRLGMVGGTCGGDACIWELGDDERWIVVEMVPRGMRERILGGKGSWGEVKCVGINGAVCLFKDLGSGFVVWREVFGEGKWEWEWEWVDGCCSIKGKEVRNFPIKGLLLHPDLGLDSIC